MANPRSNRSPHVVLTGLLAIWALSFVVAKVALGWLSPYALVGLRFWIAAACLLPLFLRAPVGERRRAARAGALAGLALALGYVLQMAGIRETSASMGGFLTGLIVLLIAVGGRLFFGARFGRASVAGLALGLAGIVLLCLPADGAGARRDTLRGILLQIGSSTSYAAHALSLSWFGRGLPAVPFTFWQMLVVAVSGTGLTMIDGTVLVAAPAPGADALVLVAAVAYLSLIATAFAIAVQAKVQHRIPANHLALLFALQPLFAALFGWLLQGDRLGVEQWAGGALIVLGVAVTARDRA